MNNIVDANATNAVTIKNTNAKNNNFKKMSFMKLINPEVQDIKEVLGSSKEDPDDSRHSSLEQKKDTDIKSAVAVKDKKDIPELFNHDLVIITAQVSGRDNASVKAELHEQKWYSIGKLSYIDVQKQEMKNANFDGQQPVKNNFINSGQGAAATLMFLQADKKYSDVLNSGILKRNEVVESSKEKTRSNVSNQLQMHDEIEKRKVTLFKDGDENALVVRDYVTNKQSLTGYISQLFSMAKAAVSKITVNGKEVK